MDNWEVLTDKQIMTKSNPRGVGILKIVGKSAGDIQHEKGNCCQGDQ